MDSTPLLNLIQADPSPLKRGYCLTSNLTLGMKLEGLAYCDMVCVGGILGIATWRGVLVGGADGMGLTMVLGWLLTCRKWS